jgi:hypothetical protein
VSTENRILQAWLSDVARLWNGQGTNEDLVVGFIVSICGANSGSRLRCFAIAISKPERLPRHAWVTCIVRIKRRSKWSKEATAMLSHPPYLLLDNLR